MCESFAAMSVKDFELPDSFQGLIANRMNIQVQDTKGAFSASRPSPWSLQRAAHLLEIWAISNEKEAR